jgi:hypothetical protein
MLYALNLEGKNKEEKESNRDEYDVSKVLENSPKNVT